MNTLVDSQNGTLLPPAPVVAGTITVTIMSDGSVLVGCQVKNKATARLMLNAARDFVEDQAQRQSIEIATPTTTRLAV